MSNVGMGPQHENKEVGSLGSDNSASLLAAACDFYHPATDALRVPDPIICFCFSLEATSHSVPLWGLPIL